LIFLGWGLTFIRLLLALGLSGKNLRQGDLSQLVFLYDLADKCRSITNHTAAAWATTGRQLADHTSIPIGDALSKDNSGGVFSPMAMGHSNRLGVRLG
jgi:hypothetical protein